MKFLKKSVWCMVGIFFMLLSMIFFIGGKVANQYDSYINEFFGTQNFKIIPSEEGELFNDYPSDYLNEDGSFNDKAMRDNSLRVAKEVATEGSVLLQNKENALPLKENSKISFFGISSNKYLFSGAGSGHLGVSVTSNLSEACAEVGLKVNPTLANAYKILASKYGSFLTESGTTISGTSIGDKCYVEYGINEVPWSELNKTTIGNVSSSFEQYSDAAFLIISRNDGEDGDTNYYTPECIDGCYLDLAHREIEILDQLMEFKKNGVFKKVVLLINSANPMQMKHIQTYDLDAIVWLGIGGNVSYQQIADLISGKANPSGRLIDTYLYDNYSSPSSVNLGDFTFAHSDGLPAREQYTHNNKYIVYQEGIYVGYRYFETRYEDLVLQQGNASSEKGSLDGEKWSYEKNVAYPFGYGQSYTTFQQDRFRVEESSNGYQVKVRVTNTGTMPGKDVVQVYLQKPYTDYDKEHKLEKASVELVGFAKTKLLQPKESEEISIFVEKDALKSYDAYGYRTYIVEDGDYYLAIGQNAHDALNAILAKKGKTTADGMDQEGNEKQAYSFHLSQFDKERYSLSKTGYPITNQFDDADPTLYEGTKDQFSDFHYLSRSDYEHTYPTKVVMDCVTQRMKDDLQYVGKIEEDETLSLPTFGQKGEHSLMEMYGLSYDDKAWEALLNQVTWEEAVTLITYGGGTGGVVSVNAPNGLAKDGPGGIGQGNPNLPNIMCFPCECLMAATFNRDLIEDLGNAFGMEILHVGYTGIYGPGANIHRSPFSGRNWEYYSEDGYLSGQMLAKEVKGLQNRGVIVFTKHFLLNDQERNRYGVSVWSNEQAIREIYLKAFEAGVTEGKMNGIMSSFNRIGTAWAGKHRGLLTEVLRNEWGFLGIVQTDAYVGTHMHRALAESVVAGNDFTMGGSNPTALDAYRNNPTVANAVRETVHRILYTKLHSNAMNGMTVNSKIVAVTPWWQSAISIGGYTTLSLCILCFVLFALSFLLPALVKKKEKLQNEKPDQNIHYFFDVISKKMTLIASLSMALILASSITIPIVLKYGKNPGTVATHVCQHVCPDCGGCLSECSNPNCQEKCSCERPCDHACPICGKCLDFSSSDTNCQEKCGEHYTHTQVFEAEDSHVLKYAGERGALGVASETEFGAMETYIGGYNANLGAKIKYQIVSSEDRMATLFVSICKREAPQLFTNNILVTVNQTIIESKGVVPSLQEGENNWTTFVDVCLGCISLKEGRNVISFTVANDDVSCGFNFNSITIKSDEELQFYEGEHICDDLCPQCGGCRNEYCEDPQCVEKCICNMDVYLFSLKDGRAELEGVSLSNGVVHFTSPQQKITYHIKSNQPTKGILSLQFQGTKGDLLSELWTILLNGKEIELPSTSLETDEMTTTKIGLISLLYGENTIEIVSKGKEVTIQGIQIGSHNELTYQNPYEFLVTRDEVMVEGDAYKSSENCISMNENAAGSIITFPLASNKETKVDLYLILASRSTPTKIADILSIKNNGIAIETEADLPTIGQEFFTYNEVFIAEITLSEGYNEITIEVLNNNPSINTNLRALLFKNTNAEINWSQSSSSYQRTWIEAEQVEIVPVIYQGSSYPFVASGQASSGDQYLGGVNDAGLYGPGQGILRFQVHCDRDTKAKLYFRIGISGSAKASSYLVKVNGQEYTSKQSWASDGWYDWKDQYFGRIDLITGNNLIEITILKNEPINMDALILESMANITFQGNEK